LSSSLLSSSFSNHAAAATAAAITLRVWRAIMSSSLVRMVHTEIELDWGWKLSRIIPTTAVDSVIEGYQRKSAIDGRSEVCQIRETRLPARPPASFSNSPGRRIAPLIVPLFRPFPGVLPAAASAFRTNPAAVCPLPSWGPSLNSRFAVWCL